jgi:hypothetical protein
MNIDIVKTSQEEGAVFVKYHLSKVSPEYSVTLPFRTKEDGMVEFKISEEALRDIVELIKCSPTTKLWS